MRIPQLSWVISEPWCFLEESRESGGAASSAFLSLINQELANQTRGFSSHFLKDAICPSKFIIYVYMLCSVS